MSTTIDQRVVEMRFDNTQFEKNISQSTESLEKLRKSLDLDNCAKSFETIEQAARGLNLSSVTESVQTVSSSFNALESIANGVFTRLGWNVGQWVSDMVRRFNQFSLFGQSGLGWTKYGELTQSTQTIVAAGYAIGEVEDALERLNWYTDETSYNFTDMANNIGKFTAQGVDLEVAATAMQGISNWAARSGQTAGEAGRAMYNLSQALSMGALTNMDWKSIENANMATKEFKETAIETGIALGTLKRGVDGLVRTTTKKGMIVDANTFRNTLSERWLDADVLLGTLEKYGAATNELYAIGEKTGLTATQMLQALDSYEKGTSEWEDILSENGSAYVSAQNFGNMLKNLGREENRLGLESFKMAQAALTFEQAMDAVSDAASTTWMNIFNKIFGTFEDAKGLWTNVANDLYDIFVEPVNELLEFITKNFDSGFSQIEDILSVTGASVDEFEDNLINLAKEAGMIGKGIEESIRDGSTSFYDIFTNKDGLFPAFKDAAKNQELVNEAIRRMMVTTNAAKPSLEEYEDLVSRIMIGEFGNGEVRMKKLTEAGYDYEFVQGLVNKKIYEGGFALEDLAGAQVDVSEATEDQIKQLEELFDAETEVGKAYARALRILSNRSNRDLLAESIHRTLSGIGDIGSFVRKIFGNLFDEDSSSALNNIIDGIFNLSVKFSDFAESISKNEDLIKSVSETLGSFLGIFRAVFGVTGTIASSAVRAIKNVVSAVTGLFKAEDGTEEKGSAIMDLFSILGDAFETVSGWIDNIAQQIAQSDFIQTVINAIAGACLALYQGLVDLWTFIDANLPEGENIFYRLGTAIENWYAAFTSNPEVKKYFGWIIKAATKAYQKISGFLKTFPKTLGDISTWFSDIITKIQESETIQTIWSVIKTVVEGAAGAIYLLYQNIVNAISFIDSHLPEGTNLFERLGLAIKNLWEEFKENPVVQKYFGWLIDKAEEIGENVPGLMENASEGFGKFVDYMDEKTKGGTDILGGIVKMLGEAKTALLALFSFNDVDWGNFFGNENIVPNFTKGVFQNFSEGFQSILKQGGEDGEKGARALKTLTDGMLTFTDATDDSYWRIKGWGQTISEKFQKLGDEIVKLDTSQIVGILAGGSLTAGFIRIATAFEGLSTAAQNISKPFLEFKNILGEVKGIAKAYKTQIKTRTFILIAAGILAIAVSISLLLGAVWLFSKYTSSIKDVAPGLVALGAVIVMIAGFYAAISYINSKFGGVANAASVAVIIISLSFSILLLVGALALLNLVNPSIKSVVVLGAIIFAIGVFINTVKGLNIFKAIGLMVGLIAMSAFLFTFALSLALLDFVVGRMKNPWAVFGILLGAILAIGVACALAEKVTQKIVASLAMWIALPLALLIMAAAFATLASIDYTEWKKASVALGVGIGLVIGMLVNVKLLKVSQDSLKAAGSVVLMALALIIIAKAFEMALSIPLGKGDALKFIGIMVAMGVMMFMMMSFAAVIANTSEGGNAIKVGLFVVMLASALIIIAGAMLILSSLDAGSLLVSTAALVAIMYGIKMVLEASKDATNQMATVLALAALILVLVLAFAALQALDWVNGIVKSIVAIGAVVVMLVWVLKTCEDYDGDNSFKPIAAFTAMLLAITIAVAVMNKVSWDAVWRTLVSVGAVLLMFVGLLWAFDKIGNIVDSVAPLIAMSVVLIVIAAAIRILSDTVDPDTLNAVTGSIMGIMIALGIMVAIIGKFGQGATLPLLSLAAVFISLGLGLYFAVTAIEKFVSMISSMDLSQIASLGYKIGAFIPLIITGIIQGFATAFPALIQTCKDLLVSLFTWLFHGAIELITVTIPELWNKFIEFIKGIDWSRLLEVLKEKFLSAWEDFKDFVKGYDPGKLYYEEPVTNAATEMTSAFYQVATGTFENPLAPAIAGSADDAVTASEAVGEEAGRAEATSFTDVISSTLSEFNGSEYLTEGAASSLTGVSDSLFESFTSGGFNADSLRAHSESSGTAVLEGFSSILSNDSSVIEKVQQFCENIIAALKKRLNFDTGHEIGYDLGSGMENGAKEAVESNSPSKKFYEIGEYCVEGLVNAVRQLSGTAVNAGYDLGTSVLEATATSLAGMYSILEGDEMIMPSVGLVGSSSMFQNGYGISGGLNGSTYGYSTTGYSRNGLAGYGNTTNNTPTFNIYQQPGEDSEDLARIINRELGRLLVS